MNKLFVYGTLKKGFQNYDATLLENFYISGCNTIDLYPLVVANKYYSPVLINEKGVGNNVFGELYEINQNTLDLFDTLEGVGTKLGYTRRLIDIKTESGEKVEAFAYMKDRTSLTAIHSEYLSVYELDQRYVLPRKRKFGV